jgi:uncharacterized membrane protein
LLGAFFAICAAFSFALNNAASRRGVISASVIQGMAITVPMGVPLFALFVTMFGQWGAFFGFSGRQVFWLSAAGCLHFLWGRYCNYRANKAIGTNLAGPAGQSDIIITLSIAVLALGEKVTPLRALGIVLVVLGPMVTMLDDIRSAKRAEAKKLASGWRPNYGEGYTFALLSGLGYGLSPICVRLGMQDAGIGAGFAGPLVSYIAAVCVFSLMYLRPGQWAHVRQIDGRSARIFCIAGCTVFMSHMFRYLALSVAPVSVVQPIQRLSLIFRFGFSWWFNPGHEVFSTKVFWSTGLALCGALLLSLSTDFVLAHIPAPPWLAAFLRLEWP